MPNTRSQGKTLEQPIDEVDSFIILSRRIKEFHLKYNIPDPNILEPVMAENPNRPLQDYVVPPKEEPHNRIDAPAIDQNYSELKTLLL